MCQFMNVLILDFRCSSKSDVKNELLMSRVRKYDDNQTEDTVSGSVCFYILTACPPFVPFSPVVSTCSAIQWWPTTTT